VLLAKDLIDEARDYHIAFDPQRIQDRILLRVLSRAERAIYQLVNQEADEVLSVWYLFDAAEIAAALANDAPIPLPENLLVGSGYVHVTNTDQKYPLTILASFQQHNPARPWRPTVWIDYQGMWLVDLRRFGGTETGWENYDEIVAEIVQAPPQLTAPTDVLTLPDITRNALVDVMVAFMAGRTSVNVGISKEDVDRSLKEAAMTLIRQSHVGEWRVRRVS
jgi:hypothetical protein